MMEVVLRCLFAFCILASTAPSFSQNLVLLDSASHKAVPFATVSVNRGERGAYSNIDGSFSLDIKAGDTLAISHINYQPYTYYASTRKNDTLYLKEAKAIQLREVVVEIRQEAKTQLISLKKTNNKLRQIPGFMVGNLITGKPGQLSCLKSITLPLKVSRKEKPTRFRINIFSPSDSGFNERPVLSYIFSTDSVDRKITLPIESEIIVDEKGILIAFEWLGNPDYGTEHTKSLQPDLYFSKEYTYETWQMMPFRPDTWNRMTEDPLWARFPPRNIAMEIELSTYPK